METNKLKRIGDVLFAFDSEEIFGNLKLSGESALQFLLMDVGFLTSHLTFDLHTDLTLEEVNQLRKDISGLLPVVLMKKNFSIDVKKSVLTGGSDAYVIVDQVTKDTYQLTFDYLNRRHILAPEYFARKDELFTDLHLNTLSTLENYGIYFSSLFYGNKNFASLKSIMYNHKILPQQYPFVRKIVAFYQGLHEESPNEKILFESVDVKYHDFLKEISSFNEKETEFLSQFSQGNFEPSLLFGGMIGENLKKHPKALLLAKKRSSK